MTPKQIKALRKNAGLTLKEVSEMMGYKNIQTWQKFEITEGLSTHRPIPKHCLELFLIKIKDLNKP